jgi:hypothetical protein
MHARQFRQGKSLAQVENGEIPKNFLPAGRTHIRGANPVPNRIEARVIFPSASKW